MKIIYKEKGNGKTLALIKRADQLGSDGVNCYIVCQNKDRALAVHKHAEYLHLQIHLPLTYHDILNHYYYDKNIDCFLIDDVDMFLERILPFPAVIDSISLTKQGD